MRQLHIFRVIWDWPPPWTGLSPGPYYLSVAQQKIGNIVHVVTGGWPRQSKAGLPGGTVTRLPSGLIPGVNGSVFITTAPAALLYYLYKKITTKVDIIHVHGHLSLFFSLYKKLFGWLDPTPLVVHLHHVSYLRAIKIKQEQQGKPSLLTTIEWKLHVLAERLAVKQADLLVVISASMKEEITSEYSVPVERILLLENGVPTEQFKPQGEVVDLDLDVSIKLLFIGSLNKRKNPDLILQALVKLPEYGAVFVGPDHLDGELQRLAEELGVRDRVQFLGVVPNQELDTYIRAVDIFILPSKSEGFPKVVLEALACGKPVVASGFYAGEAFDHVIEYLSSMDTEGMVTAIQAATSKIGTIDPGFIQNDYSWDSRAQVLQQSYVALLQG